MHELIIKKMTPTLPKINPMHSILSSKMKEKISFCLNVNLNGKK